MAGLIDRAAANLQPELTDPEHGWREAEQAIDAAVARFGPGVVQRAALARSRRRPEAGSDKERPGFVGRE